MEKSITARDKENHDNDKQYDDHRGAIAELRNVCEIAAWIEPCRV